MRGVSKSPQLSCWHISFFLLVVTSIVGQWSGKRTYDDFVFAATENRSELESATMTDGAILEQVYLVGTTSRTAVFLQKPIENGPGGFDVAPGYIETWLKVIGLFPLPTSIRKLFGRRGDMQCPSERCVGEIPCRQASNSGKYRVLVVDRAHVLCHTKGNICETLPGRQSSRDDE